MSAEIDHEASRPPLEERPPIEPPETVVTESVLEMDAVGA